MTRLETEWLDEEGMEVRDEILKVLGKLKEGVDKDSLIAPFFKIFRNSFIGLLKSPHLSLSVKSSPFLELELVLEPLTLRDFLST